MKHLYIFSLLLLALLLPATALAHDFEVDGIYYNINGNEACVTRSPSSNKYSGDVTIPATVTYNGTTYSVTSIGSSAFSSCTGLTSITIGNSVTSIGNSAFRGCSSLTSVTIPNSVSTIGDLVFADCSSLNSITIPNSVTSIGNSAFSGCNGLTSIDIPNSVTSIGSNAFGGTPWYDNQPDGLVYAGLVAYSYKGTMPSGTNITLRDGTLGISSHAFGGCSGLTSITIPNSVTFIGDLAFDSCTGLTSITIPNTLTSIGFSIFSNCTGLTNVTIPNSITTIGGDAFANCSGLSSITIPSTVTSIGDNAFCGCSSLTRVIIPDNVEQIGDYTFSNCTNLTEVTIGKSVKKLYYGTFERCDKLKTVYFKAVNCEGLSWYEGFSPFANCQLEELVFGDDVVGIPNGIAYGQSFLTDIEFPNSVTSIGELAFRDCYNLTSITIPNSVTSIGNYAFLSSGLTKLTIPSTVTYIGHGAFNYSKIDTLFFNAKNCTIGFPSSGDDWPSGCFATQNLRTVIIGDGVKELPSLFLANNPSLSTVIIPNSVTAFGRSAFYNCSGLTNITIPNSVTTIGDVAFSGCSSLTDIYCLNLTPPTIDSYTFNGCDDATLYVPSNAIDNYKVADYWKEFTNIDCITFEVDNKYYRVLNESEVRVIANNNEAMLYTGDVVIPDSVTYEGMSFAVTGIESNAFDGCFELTSVVIPNSVESIGEQAFQGCTGLTSVTIGSGVTAIGAKAFNYCNALETVKCLGTVPPVMASADCFSTAAYNRATLLVPRNSESTYSAADYWYKFAHIDGWGSAGRGDIDGDGEVSIRDVTRMIDAILTGEHEGVYFESADLNNNGRLDIGDVTTIIDMLLNGE